MTEAESVRGRELMCDHCGCTRWRCLTKFDGECCGDCEHPAATQQMLTDLVTRLRAMAAQEFDERGPHDPRGAAIWDVAAFIAEDYAPALAARADMHAVVDGLRTAAQDLREGTRRP